MRNRGWIVVAALLAAGLPGGPLRAEGPATLGSLQGRSDGLSDVLRFRAAAALGIGSVEGRARLAPGVDAGVQSSASPQAVLHGVVGRPFAPTPWVLPPSALPQRIALRSGPNPFRGGSEMWFDLPQPSSVDLRIYDLAGREVRTLIGGQPFPAGTHTRAWDGRQRNGQMVRPGVYFVRLRTDGAEVCRRVVKL